MTAINLGGAVAENDRDLNEYFLRTADFEAFCSLKYDIVLGVKGSGKSAISRILADPSWQVAQLSNVDVIPLLDLNNEVLLQRLAQDWTPESMRAIWLACFASVVGSHLVREYGSTRNLGDLSKMLSESGLAELDVAGTPALKRIVDLFSRIVPEASVHITETGTPVITGAFKTKQDSKRESSLNLALVPRILGEIEQVLAGLDRRCLIVIDRLDEAFSGEKELEGHALRSLLQGQLDVRAACERWQVASFLRPDILNGVTSSSGFRNLDHLRVLPLSWTNEAIMNMLARRLRWSLTIDEDAPLDDSLYGIIPRRLNLHDEYDKWGQVAGVYWLSIHSAGHPNQPSPRNILTLLDLALHHARRGRKRAAGKPAIAPTHLSAAWRDLSDMRFADTLQAEFPGLRGLLEALRYSPAVITADELAMRIAKATPASQGVEPSDLVESGLLEARGPDSFRFNRLYWPALEVRHARQ